ncbi:MAG: DUF1073 domain-containing protein [Clostridia bacterium]|nr:DUF1073 domain-containing protein [Clostridia bacterium]
MKAKQDRRGKGLPRKGIPPGRGRIAAADTAQADLFPWAEDAPEGPCLTDQPRLLTDMYRRSWLAKRIIDMPCEDMTRLWYTLPADLPPEDRDALARLEARHGIRREITDAIRWARLYGGACALMVLRGQERRLAEPLDPDDVAPGDFQGLLVRDRYSGLEPSLETEEDLDDPDFGYPKYYDFDTETLGRLRVHHSRILRFTGRDLPQTEELAQGYFGASELEHIQEELEKRTVTSRNIARLVFQANITTLKMSDFGEILALGTDRQKQQVLSAIAEQNRLRDSFGLQLLSAGDTYENHPYSFAGLGEVYEAFLTDMAGAAGIPATRLFGRSPEGMNATGESDLKNYYELIDQMRERHLRPALEKLLPVMALSCWGCAPEDLRITFPSLVTVSPREEADIRARETETVIQAVAAGLLTPAEGRERILNL